VGGDVDERKWAALGGGADTEVVATGIEGSQEIGPDRVQILDAGVDLRQFCCGPSLEARVDLVAVAVSAQRSRSATSSSVKPSRARP
jgi:hypothetical protein